MPLLYYWRPDNYWRDLDQGAGYQLNQANPLLHEIDLGDSLWAFTRARNGKYVLAAELVIRAKTKNAPGFRYGPNRVWGDLKRSRYFEVEGQLDAEQVVRELSVTTNAQYLGQSFQGYSAVKRLSDHDHQILTAFARDLPLESRARVLSEERLEDAIRLGGSNAVYDLINEGKTGIAEERQTYLYQDAPTRNRQLVAELQELYEGTCQVTGWAPSGVYGYPLCHGHHIQWLSRGGEDTLENMILISPNLHAAIHRCDAPFDYERRAFIFDQHIEPVRFNKHLPLQVTA